MPFAYFNVETTDRVKLLENNPQNLKLKQKLLYRLQHYESRKIMKKSTGNVGFRYKVSELPQPCTIVLLKKNYYRDFSPRKSPHSSSNSS